MNYLIIGIKSEIMKNLFLLILFSIVLSSCWKTESEIYKRKYYIENSTDIELRLIFYNKYIRPDNPEHDVELNPGEQFKTDYEQTQDFEINKNRNIYQAMNADSAIIFFENKAFTTYVVNKGSGIFSKSLERNIFNIENWVDIGNDTFVYKITEEDYEQALPLE